jgi:carboxylesterase type B
VARIEAAYPPEDYATEADRCVQMTTDLFFRCGTRRSARVLSDSSGDNSSTSVFLYNFNHQ